ncbi:MAG: hypothetical protein LBI03_10885, partial [Clostridiales bacterium]|nr:hypothetical protein [Clostridiales bacterium]
MKIYKGFQPKENGSAFIDAQNPDSIYYYDNITVVLEEYDNDKRTQRQDIQLYITHDFPRDSGIFYYKEEKILYYTSESIDENKIYNIKITNKINGNVIQGRTAIVGDFTNITPSSVMNMLSTPSISFTIAPNAAESGYEFYLHFLYFEVNRTTKQVEKIGKISKNIIRVG